MPETLPAHEYWPTSAYSAEATPGSEDDARAPGPPHRAGPAGPVLGRGSLELFDGRRLRYGLRVDRPGTVAKALDDLAELPQRFLPKA